MEAMRIAIRNQKKSPSAIAVTFSAVLVFSLDGWEGSTAIMINETTATRKKSGKKATPHNKGPKGTIQSWPAQPTKKRITKNRKSPRKGRGPGAK